MKLRDYPVLIIIFVLFFQQTLAQTWSKLMPATSTAPVPRLNAVGIYDDAGNRLIIYGGRNNDGNLNDVWAFDVTSNTWSDITPSDTNAPGPRFGHNAIYDSQKRRMIVWSGQQTSNGFFNDIWAFDLAAQTWEELTPDSGSPNKRYGSGSIYDAAINRLVMFAGFTDQGRFNDTRAFDLDSNKWIDLTPSGTKPEIRCLLAASYDSLHHRMLMYAGQHSGALSDIWEFDLTSNQWRDITPADKPQGRFFSSGISTNTSMIIFGGNSGSKALNDTWSFDLKANSWKELVADSTFPEHRYGHVAVYIPEEHAMVIFSGSGSQLYNDVWKLSGIITSIQNKPELPEKIMLFQNYPNPFNPATTIRYTLASPQFVSLKVYDILGREIQTLVEEHQPTGKYQIRFEPANVSSGVYIYRLQNRSQSLTRSMLFLK